jgi:uncharacterized protein (DUF169 family)
MNAANLETWDEQLRHLTNSKPVALAFTSSLPPGLRRRPAAQASGCSFWKVAADDGEPFYTEASDHFGCTVGAYTHGADLPPPKQEELSSTIGTMVSLTYLREDEVPQIARRSAPLRFVVYARLAQSPVPPDVVLVRGNARQLMILTEAGRAAGHVKACPTMGRPACAAIPLSMASGEIVVSMACIGNRVYTELPDDEGYVAIPGGALESTMSKLDSIVRANDALEKLHRQRKADVRDST